MYICSMGKTRHKPPARIYIIDDLISTRRSLLVTPPSAAPWSNCRVCVARPILNSSVELKGSRNGRLISIPLALVPSSGMSGINRAQTRPTHVACSSKSANYDFLNTHTTHIYLHLLSSTQPKSQITPSNKCHPPPPPPPATARRSPSSSPRTRAPAPRRLSG